jgi:hypothetical protein
MIGGASVAVRDKKETIVVSSARPLTFSERPGVQIPAHTFVFSDPLDLIVPPMADLAIDLYVPGNTDQPSPLTFHNAALQTNYISEPGNHAGQETFPAMATTTNWFVLARVEVVADQAVGTIVAFGASLTDGIRSTPDMNRRWPNHLARRLLDRSTPMAVLAEGIAGNRLLRDWQFSRVLAASPASIQTHWRRPA